MRQTLAVIGDLHYEPKGEADFARAREQFQALPLDTVFQLGDHGGYTHCGSWRSYQEGLGFLSDLGAPFHTLMGNHDLEGEEYASDDENVAAFLRAFGYERPYRAVDLGDALGICLSSTSFRSNPFCHHEVRLDATQIAWLEATLAANRHRPTFVFSHAPIIGSGLRVLQSIHLKCPNAWLNHTDDPGRYIRLLQDNPQVKLWFSAHDHLSHDYHNSVSCVGECHFVHVGVIGEVSRDGRRLSRLVEFDADGFTLATLDHVTGERRDDLTHDYSNGESVQVYEAEGGDESEHFGPPPFPQDAKRLEAEQSVFAVHRGMLVEFDRELEAPIGVVSDQLGDTPVRVQRGRIYLTDRRGEPQIIAPDASGRFRRVYVPSSHRYSRRVLNPG